LPLGFLGNRNIVRIFSLNINNSL